MGNSIVPIKGHSGYLISGKRKIDETYNTRVALWHLPYNKNYLEYDNDDSRWFESSNKYGDDELEQAKLKFNINFDNYKISTKTTQYNDGTYNVESSYPNKMTVSETHGKEHVFVWIKDKFNRLIAEKIFNNSSSDGRKIVYTYIKQGENTFTIVKIYSYDTTKNKATDAVNYAYTSNLPDFIKGCIFEKEYYMLNGKEVKAKKIDNSYRIISKNGKELTFMVE